MMNIADDFYDENAFGYDRVHGDWHSAFWITGTRGRREAGFPPVEGCTKASAPGDMDRVLDAVYEKVEENPFEGYKAYVDETCRLYGNKSGSEHSLRRDFGGSAGCGVDLRNGSFKTGEGEGYYNGHILWWKEESPG